MKNYFFGFLFITLPIGVFAQWEYVFETTAQFSAIYGISFVNDSTGYIGVRAEENNLDDFYSSMLILKTQDFGTSWDTVFFEIDYCPCPSGVIRRVTDVHFIDEQNGFFTTADNNIDACQIISTSDGGESWFEHEIELTKLEKIDMLNNMYGICYSSGGNGVETFDGGQTWTVSDLEFSRGVHLFDECNKMSVYSGLIRKEVDCTWSLEGFPTIDDEPSRSGRAVHAWDEENYIMGAAGLIGFDNFASILRTTDGGESYTFLDFPFGGGTGDFTFTNDSTGYISSYSGSSFYQSTYQTTDRGITWQGVNTPFNDDGNYESLVSPSFIGEDICYAINSKRTKVLRTLTGVGELGQSWTMVPEQERTAQLKIYPNPATNHLNLSWSTTTTGNALVRMTTLEGKIVLEEETNASQQHTIDTSAFAEGFYLLTVQMNNQWYVEKVVIRGE